MQTLAKSGTISYEWTSELKTLYIVFAVDFFFQLICFFDSFSTYLPPIYGQLVVLHFFKND